MTSNRWTSWRAQEPCAGFTERTVAALLFDKRRRRAFPGRRWIAASAIAAVMAGGAAWGLGAISLGSRPLPAPPPGTTAPAPSPVPHAVHAPPAEPAPPPSASAAPRRKVEAPASPATPRRRVVVPRCFCSPNDAMCDCF
jgi:hypothetical protein